MKEQYTQQQHEDKSQTHKRVGITQFKLRQRRQPAKQREETRGGRAQNPGIEKQVKQERDSFGERGGERAGFRDLPFHNNLAVHSAQNGAEDVSKPGHAVSGVQVNPVLSD